MKIAWSPFFGSYIKCVKFNNDTDWYFSLVGHEDCIHKAQAKHSFFEWFTPLA